MSWAALGFFRATHAHTHQNLYLYTRVWVLVDTGWLGITHGYQNLYGIKTCVHIKRDYAIKKDYLMYT